MIRSVGTTPNVYLYCGERWDSDLGLYYLRARHLNPGTGRFMTMDTFEGAQTDPVSLHKYLYAHANPVNRVDPSGYDPNFNIASITTTLGIIGMQASQYISRMPAMAANAFRTGGQAVSSFFQQFGPVVQNFGRQVIELVPKVEQLRPILEGFSRRPDFVLRAGNTLRALEGKYQLPSGGEALTRLGSQLQQFTKWASQGTGREVVVWALKSPVNVAEAEQAVLQAAGNPQGVRFVYGVEGLFQYLSQWAGF